MLIISRYFLREFLKTFLLCMLAFLVLYVVVDLFERLDDMISRRVPLWIIIQYYLCSLPLIVYQVSPLGVLLCSFITIGVFVRHQEITALKAGGVSLSRVLKVVVAIACFLCFFSIWLQEYVIPVTHTRVQHIKNVHFDGKQLSHLFKKRHFWYKNNNTVYNIDYFNPDANMLQNMVILYFTSENFLYRRVETPQAQWFGGTWHCTDVTVREFTPEGAMETKKLEHMQMDIEKTPDDLRDVHKEDQELGFSEIRKLIKRLTREGYPVTALVVDMHAKISYACINIIMAVLGIPFALRIGRSGGMALGIAISIAIGFFYWIFFAFCLSLGKGGAIAPFVSAWLANVAFGALGLYMFLHVRQ